MISDLLFRHYFGEVETSDYHDIPSPSIPDVAADADRQDLSNRVSENNLSNTLKSRLPKIGPAHPYNGSPSNYLPKRPSPQKPLRLQDPCNRPVLPPKPKMKQMEMNSERHDTVPRAASLNSYAVARHLERNYEKSGAITDVSILLSPTEFTTVSNLNDHEKSLLLL